ncbi:MAG: glycosyltransferase [Acidobacteriaceae bacterium]|nr:glycosyltransferase [Acidobacteriaceae bacterium]
MPNGEGTGVCVVVPCYNEAARLNVDAFRHYLAHTELTRLIFVDDGSKDETLTILKRLCWDLEDKTEVLACEANSGKAEAVRRGMMHALRVHRPEMVGFWDADLATPLDDIDCFHGLLRGRSELEMVFGSRVKLLGRHIERKAARHYLGRIFATVVSTMLELPIYDTQCGAKLFRVTEGTREIFADRFLSKWVFDVEIIARYQRLYRASGKKLETAIYEYPLECWVDVAGSKVKPRDFVTALVDVARIKSKYLP